MPATYVVYHFVDNNGKRAEMRLHFTAAALSSEGGGPGVIAVRDALVALSDARLTHYEVVHFSGDLASPPPAPTSNLFRRVSLLYRNGTEYGSIFLLSPVAVPPEPDDPYGAGRLTRGALLLSGLLGNAESIVSGTVKPDGSPFPATFVVGGTAGGEL